MVAANEAPGTLIRKAPRPSPPAVASEKVLAKDGAVPPLT
jgi:hypothetical protein